MITATQLLQTRINEEPALTATQLFDLWKKQLYRSFTKKDRKSANRFWNADCQEVTSKYVELLKIHKLNLTPESTTRLKEEEKIKRQTISRTKQEIFRTTAIQIGTVRPNQMPQALSLILNWRQRKPVNASKSDFTDVLIHKSGKLQQQRTA